ncbi:MAG: hypothetical protein PUC88_07175 [Clostridia bacterium]|nr:hypothetical protein [Clostridia bacterium]
MSDKFPLYRGKPLVRSGDVLYYGDMSDKYVVRLTVKSKKMIGDKECADKVAIQLMSTDLTLSPRKQIIKASEKEGLFLAMDIASVWLDRALAGKA